VSIGREHRVPDALDAAVALEPAQPGEEDVATDGERGEAERVGECVRRVAQHRERQVQPIRELALVAGSWVLSPRMRMPRPLRFLTNSTAPRRSSWRFETSITMDLRAKKNGN